jgi:hypothetical protein
MPQNSTTNILDLPDEVLAAIFSFVEPFEAVKHLPCVCRRFRAIVQNRIPWPTLSLKVINLEYAPSAVKAIFQAARNDAELVQFWAGGSLWELMNNVLLRIFLEFKWNKLRRVRLPVGKGFSKVVTVAPNLVELKLVTSHPFEDWMWEEVAALAAHASLKKICITAFNFSWPQSLDYNQVLVPLLTKLESFLLFPSAPFTGNPKPVVPPAINGPNVAINLGQDLQDLKEVQVT